MRGAETDVATNPRITTGLRVAMAVAVVVVARGPAPAAPGVYYLAISAFNVDPVFEPPEGPVTGCPLPVSIWATPPTPGEGAIVGTEGNDVIFALGHEGTMTSSSAAPTSTSASIPRSLRPARKDTLYFATDRW